MTQVYRPGDKVKLFYGFADRHSSGVYEIVRSLPASADNEGSIKPVARKASTA
jgi:hypothetical protein